MSVAASLIATTMNASTPLLLAALGILVAERSGVLNLGVEGIMLMAAIVAYMGAVESGSFAVGFLAAILIGHRVCSVFCDFRSRTESESAGVRLRCRDLRIRTFGLYRHSVSGSSAPGKGP